MSNKRIFDKKPLTIPELIQKLANKGLVIENDARTQKYLRDIGYYRLVGYGLAFEQYHEGQRLGKYQQHTHFKQLLNAYIVDRKLRLLVLAAIERIEVAVRSIIIQTLCEKYQSAHWYLEPTLFKSSVNFSHENLLKEIARITRKKAAKDSEQDKGRELFIRHYYQRYTTPDYPPSWMLAEVLSLGSWSKIYEHLAISKDRKNIAKQLDLSPITLESWLHSLVIVRNICAHHGRLFARKLTMPPKKDKKLPLQKNNAVFNFICILAWLMKEISPTTQWLNEITNLFTELESDLKYYGLPASSLDALEALKKPYKQSRFNF